MTSPIADHPHTDPGDGRTECNTCGKYVWLVTHSCKGIPVTEAARARHQAGLKPGACQDGAPHLWGIDGRCDTCGVHQDGTDKRSKADLRRRTAGTRPQRPDRINPHNHAEQQLRRSYPAPPTRTGRGTMLKVKFAGAMPKPVGNEIDAATLRKIVDDRTQGRSTRPQVALLVFDAKDVAIDDEGTEAITLRLRWIQSVMSVAGRRTIQELLDSEYREQNGVLMLPHELDALRNSAFGDLPRTIEQIDADQAREQENMSPLDELRQHLRVIHGLHDGWAGLTEAEVRAQHDADHADDGAALGPMNHDPDWHGWTRADVELAGIEADEYKGLASEDAETDRIGYELVLAANNRDGDAEGVYPQVGTPWANESDADGFTDGSRAGSPHESSDPGQADNVTHVEFTGRS